MDLSQLDPRLFPDPDHPIHHQLRSAQHHPEPEPEQQQQQQQQQLLLLQEQEEEEAPPSPPSIYPDPEFCSRWKQSPPTPEPFPPQPVQRPPRARAPAREEEEVGDEMEVDEREEEEEEEEEDNGAPAPQHSPALLALLPHHCPHAGCNFIFVHAGLLEKHLAATHDAPQGGLKRFVCPVCRASYDVETQMLQHKQEHGPGHWKWRHKLPVPGGIDCPIPGCAVNLTTRQQLRDHLPRAHSGWQRLYPNLKQQRPELFSR